MSTIKDFVTSIKNINLKYSQEIPKPIVNSTVQNFKDKFFNIFETEIDKDFIEFLKLSDGIEFNGCTIYSSNNHTVDGVEYGIFENNETWLDINLDKQYIYFGDSDQDLYAYNKLNKKYEVLDRYCSDVEESFDNFENLLEYIKKIMLNE